MFIEFETAEQASLAVKLIDGFKMDKSHTLAVNRFTDVEKYSAVEEEFNAPPEEEFVEKVRPMILQDMYQEHAAKTGEPKSTRRTINIH